ncbi:MAG: EF-hand domain-containing protein [Anaerobacillus sp.]
MKLVTLTCLAGVVALGFAGAAYAGQPLNSTQCNKAWSMASPNGETLDQGKAVDYVINFTMVDSNKDGQISKDEFNDACDKGMVKADTATTKDME